MVTYFQYLKEHQNPKEFYHQLLYYLDVKCIVFLHLHNELGRYEHFDWGVNMPTKPSKALTTDDPQTE